MKSLCLRSAALLLVLCCARALPGQEASSQILSRGQYNALSTDPTLDPNGRSFPSLSPRADQPASADQDAASETSKIAGPTITVASSLAVVLGLFAALVWMTRKFGSRSLSQGSVPKEFLQSLGSTPIDSRTRITMVRCGKRILVMAQTATGVHPLSEITDPEEVLELTAACLGDAKQSFASTLQSIEKEKVDTGFVAAQASPPTPRPRRRLFASA
jgi:flagellar biogenesis protein FliO